MKNTFFGLFIVLFSIIGTGCSYNETYRVTGRVVDSVTDLPVEGAQVHLSYVSDKEMITGADGLFDIETGYEWSPSQISDGPYPELTVSKDGYNSFSTCFYNDNETLDLIVELVPEI